MRCRRIVSRLRRRQAGQVYDRIAVAHGVLNRGEIANVRVDELELSRHVGEVGKASGRHVVEDSNLASGTDQPFRTVRADESRTARNQYPHSLPTFPTPRDASMQSP